MSLLAKIKVKAPKEIVTSAALVAVHPVKDLHELAEAWGSGRITTGDVCDAFGRTTANRNSTGESLVLATFKRLYSEGYAIRSPLERRP